MGIRLILVSLLWGTLLTGCSQTRGWQRPYTAVNPDLAVSAAKEMLGIPYLYGGQTPDTGFDCSGLVVYSYTHAGVSLPRTAYGQFKVSQPISKENLKIGDLLFFRVSRTRISHVGIYLGNNRFIHAPSTGKLVSIARLDDPYWQKRFIRAGRISGRRSL